MTPTAIAAKISELFADAIAMEEENHLKGAKPRLRKARYEAEQERIAIAFARYNLQINHEEATNRLNAGEPLPPITDPTLARLLKAWEAEDEQVWRPVTRQENVKASEFLQSINQSPELIALIKAAEVLDSLPLPGKERYYLRRGFFVGIVSGELSPEEAEEIFARPDLITTALRQEERVFDMQRRVTLLKLAENNRFPPRLSRFSLIANDTLSPKLSPLLLGATSAGMAAVALADFSRGSLIMGFAAAALALTSVAFCCDNIWQKKKTAQRSLRHDAQGLSRQARRELFLMAAHSLATPMYAFIGGVAALLGSIPMTLVGGILVFTSASLSRAHDRWLTDTLGEMRQRTGTPRP